MTSHLTEEFISCFRRLPERIQHKARKGYKLWRRNRHHPSLDFKRVGKRSPVYSVRVGIGWRALGLKEGDSIIWFWIGSHSEYEKLISNF